MRRLVERRIIKENSVNKTRASPFYERRKRRAHALISYGIEVVNFNYDLEELFMAHTHVKCPFNEFLPLTKSDLASIHKP